MKEIKVKLIGNARKEYEKSTDQTLLFAINQKKNFLKENVHYGIQIGKNKIPAEYVIDYDVTNLWKVNLPGARRMIYTIRGNETKLTIFILDILDHKTYSKKFKYKK